MRFYAALWCGIDLTGFDTVAFDNVPTGTRLAAFLAQRPGHVGADRTAVTLRLHDYADLAAYMATRSGGTRKNLRRRRRKLEQVGSVGYRLIENADEIPAAIERVVDMKLGWLAERGLHGRFLARDDVKPFLVDMSLRALEVGRLHFSVLDAGR